MSNDKDWALIANALDKTLTSTALATRVGQASTSSYALPRTPKSTFVDLTLNGAYVGVYQLMETVQLNGERVDGPAVKGDTGLSSTGTYLMEINHQGGLHDYTSPKGVTIIFDNPDREIITAPQARYITDFLTTFENYLFQNNPALEADDQLAVFCHLVHLSKSLLQIRIPPSMDLASATRCQTPPIQKGNSTWDPSGISTSLLATLSMKRTRQMCFT